MAGDDIGLQASCFLFARLSAVHPHVARNVMLELQKNWPVFFEFFAHKKTWYRTLDARRQPPERILVRLKSPFRYGRGIKTVMLKFRKNWPVFFEFFAPRRKRDAGRQPPDNRATKIPLPLQAGNKKRIHPDYSLSASKIDTKFDPTSFS